MRRSIHKMLTVALLLAGSVYAVPAMADAPTPFDMEMQPVDINPVEVRAAGSNVRVKNAEGCAIEVFSITGEKLMTQRIESQSASFDLGHLPKGIYIIKVGKTTAKVYLR